MIHRGSCLCGAVTFEFDGDLRPPDACHCTQCRKQSGHYFASSDVPRAVADGQRRRQGDLVRLVGARAARLLLDLRLDAVLGPDPQGHDRDRDGRVRHADATHLEMHIFVADKGDYYEIADGLPQNQR